MEKINAYTCPICGKTYSKIRGFSDCVNSHAEDMEKREAEAKKAKEKAQITELRGENEKLVKQIKANIAELKKLGIHAVVNYKEFECRGKDDTPTINLGDWIEEIFNFND